MSAGSFCFVEGAPGDLSFLARGPTAEAALAAAGEALLAATLEDPAALEARETRRLRLAETEADLLLLRFLNELIYLRDAEQLLLRPTTLRVTRDGALRLDARLEGERVDPARHTLLSDVKAATAHGLVLRETPDGWEARATLDV
jgi:SHS2 domain-containing protein